MGNDLLQHLLNQETTATDAVGSPLQPASPPDTTPTRATRRRYARKTMPATSPFAAYEYGGLVLAELAALSVWLVFWLANGFCTALFVHDLATTTLHALGVTSDPVVMWGAGWLTHLVISLIEQHLWRTHGCAKVPEIVAIGTLDVTTTALGLLVLARAWQLPTEGLISHAIVTLLAEALAIIPERRIARHGLALWICIRSER